MLSGVFLAFAVLSKEIALLALPFVAWCVFMNAPHRNRWLNTSITAGLTVCVSGLYLLWALLKGELFSGPGHVSIQDAVIWMLFERNGSGSFFDPNSDKSGLLRYWLGMDRWMFPLGIAIALLVSLGTLAVTLRRQRPTFIAPIAGALLLQSLMIVRGGYLPQTQPLMMLPFAAILVAWCGSVVWQNRWVNSTEVRQFAMRAVVLLAAGIFVVLLTPSWRYGLVEAQTTSPSSYGQDAYEWLETHAPKQSVILTDDYGWVDLTDRGFENTVWVYKIDRDPPVTKKYWSQQWRGIDYVVLPQFLRGIISDMPRVKEAVDHSEVVAVFGKATDVGQYVIYKVQK